MPLYTGTLDTLPNCVSPLHGLCLLKAKAHLQGLGLPSQRDYSAADAMLQDASVQQTFVANPKLQSKLPSICSRVCLLKLCKGRLIITKTRWL